jgi:hypothetical protein
LGTYTTVQKLYKPASDDLVDVNTDIKYNWERLDQRVKLLLEWLPTEETNLTGNVPMENGFRYLKRSTASKWASWLNPVTQQQQFYQDNVAFVPTWTVITPAAGWSVYESQTKLMAQVTGGAAGAENIVTYRGKLIRNPNTELPIKTDTLIASGVPTGYRPQVDREVQIMGGDTASGNVATAMLRFTSTGEIHLFKYGTAQTGNSFEWYVSFTGVMFPRGD